MIASVLLLAYTVTMGSFGARRLRQASWLQRSPRGGIVAWQALSTSVVVAALLAGATLALPALPVDASMTTLLNACFLAIQDRYSTPGGATVATFAALTTLVLTGRLGYVLIVEVLTATRRRAGQRRNLLLVAHRDPRTGTLVVPHRDAAVYCLPGRDRLVVCTTSAFAALDAEQLRMVLAHERAHLRWHHHLILTGAATLRSALPFLPAFEIAEAEVLRLVEMQADDDACARGRRRDLATALVLLAGGAAPAAAIGAGGSTALLRVRRLTGPYRPLNPLRLSLIAGAALAVLVLPLLIAVGPAILAAAADYCPLRFW